MADKPDTRMALDTPADLFAKLRWEEQNLERTWGIFESFNFVITAHHLYVDWLKADAGATAAQLERKAALPEGARIVLRAITDLANGAKHWRLAKDWSISKQVITHVDGPVIGDYYAYFDGKPMMYFEFAGYNLSMAELSDFTVKYLDWIVNGDGAAFPDELEIALRALLMKS